eukprot:4148872-Pyramimonas_sp.AAC.1
MGVSSSPSSAIAVAASRRSWMSVSISASDFSSARAIAYCKRIIAGAPSSIASRVVSAVILGSYMHALPIL